MLLTPSDGPRHRLIVALDVSSTHEALAIADDLAGVVSFYKVGYQLFLAEGMPLVRELIARGNRVFLDLKMNDVDETIIRAVREITKNGVHLITLYGSSATARAAVTGRGDSASPKILSVTLLSSLDTHDLTELQVLGEHGKFATLTEYVVWRAQQSLGAGCDGLIASGDTIGVLRQRLGDTPIIVSPGIRPSGTAADEHKRSTTPREAIAAGADYLVVGRPIRNAPDRRAMAEAVIAEIGSA